MKYLKKFNESAKSSIKLKSDELSLFNTQGALRNLITDEKIKLVDDKVFYDNNDNDTISVLSNYFEVK